MGAMPAPDTQHSSSPPCAASLRTRKVRSTSDRSDLRPGIRSFHIRHSREKSREPPVANPVHVTFDRAVKPSLVEIVRMLHEHMEPSRHVGTPTRP